MKSLVVYESKYGSTRQYASWISEALGGELKPAAEADPASLGGYDAVVFGGYLFMSKVKGVEFVVRNWQDLKGKKVALFTVSASPPGSPDVAKAVEDSVPADIRSGARVFQFWGRVPKWDLRDYLLCSFPKMCYLLKYKVTGDPKYKAKAEAMVAPADHVRKEQIKPLLEYLNSP
jgi:hypothetical protein